MTNAGIALKISRVIDSCLTYEQTQMASKMLDLFSRSVKKQFVYDMYSVRYTPDGRSIKDLRDQLAKKEVELI